MGLNAKGQKKTSIRDWQIVSSYILFIYLSLPFVPRIWERLVGKIGNFSNHLACLILIVLGLVACAYLIANKKAIRSFIWLAILGCCYAFGLSRLKLAVERIHFVEYGLLSLLLFNALRHQIKTKSVYLWSGIIVFCLGLLDEGIQYILPSRVYDTRDVIVNGVAGILGLLLIGLCLQPDLKN